jgi:hypothetical protein
VILAKDIKKIAVGNKTNTIAVTVQTSGDNRKSVTRLHSYNRKTPTPKSLEKFHNINIEIKIHIPD